MSQGKSLSVTWADLPGPARTAIAARMSPASKRAARLTSKDVKSHISDGYKFKMNVLEEWVKEVKMYADVWSGRDPYDALDTYDEYRQVWESEDSQFISYHIDALLGLLGKGLSPSAALEVFVVMLVSPFREFMGGEFEVKVEQTIFRILHTLMSQKPGPDTSRILEIILHVSPKEILDEYGENGDDLCNVTLLYQQAFLLTYFLKKKVITKHNISVKLGLNFNNIKPLTYEEFIEKLDTPTPLEDAEYKLAILQRLKFLMSWYSKKRSWWRVF